MDQNHEHYHKPEPKGKWWKTPNGIVIIFFFLALGYFLITEHGAHMFPYLPWLILLLYLLYLRSALPNHRPKLIGAPLVPSQHFWLLSSPKCTAFHLLFIYYQAGFPKNTRE